MLNFFEYCFDYRIQSHFQHLSITENCILCFHHHYLSDCHIQDMHENNILQFLLCCKYFISFLNLHKLLIKQVLKVLYHLAEALLSSVVSHCVCESCHVHAEQHIFSAILTFITHSFSYCHHNLLL